MSSLDYLLGSRDEGEGTAAADDGRGAAPVQLLRIPAWAWGEVAEPRVVPLASNVIYYTLLVVYTSYYVLQMADGQEVADDVLSRLVNDHAAVASGDSLRLFTSFFVSSTLQQLIVALIALATVSAELESLCGYSVFWAIWCLTVLTGSIADAALSDMPISAGPSAGVAGIAAALLAHHVHNWRLEAQLQQAREGEVPQSWLQLEGMYNARLIRQQRQQEQEQQQQQKSPGGGAASSSSSSEAGRQQQAWQQPPDDLPRPDAAADDSGSLVATEIEGPLGLSFTLLLPKEVKALVTLGGTAVAVISALQDAAAADGSTDWQALAAGFAAGGFLGWMACPVYHLELVPASSSSSSGKRGARASAAGFAYSLAPSVQGVEQQQEPEQPPDLLLPVVRDGRPPAARANAVIGFAAALFAVLGGWLVSQGVFS